MGFVSVFLGLCIVLVSFAIEVNEKLMNTRSWNCKENEERKVEYVAPLGFDLIQLQITNTEEEGI